MNKRITACLIASLLAVGISFAQPLPKKASPAKGVVRVKMQPEVARTLQKLDAATMTAQQAGQPLQLGIKQLDNTLKNIGGVKMRRVFPCAPGREAQHRKFGLDQWYEISFDEAVSPIEARAMLKNTAGVEKASVRVPMKLLENATFRKAGALENSASRAASAPEKGASRAASAPENSASRAASALPFNDPRLASQWHYNNDGSVAGSAPGADINLFKAWQISTGSPRVVVAIIDGGVDYSHEDLAAHMWVNEAEKNGKPGVDDDGNGFIDDIYGYNFCSNDGTIYPHNHGTHVAGTVGAINNNGIGVCGVAGGDGSANSGVRLMSCQVFDSRANVAPGDFAAAVVYAADMGATIAQCSWGWDEDGYYEPDVLDAIRYFTASARSGNMTGGLCFFAAGNEGMTGRMYPGCMEEVVAVAAMNCDFTPAYYSNYGAWVDVIAPGGNTDFNEVQGVLSTLPGNSYGFSEGTSMATPHVSGIAALVLSKYGNSTLINESLRQQIVTSVNDFYSKNPNAEGLYGSGYVDAHKAMQWGDGTAPDAVSDLVAIAMQESITLNWTIPASSSNNVNSHILYYSTTPFTESNLGNAKTIVIDTKFCSSGDKFDYELKNLQPMTTYYVAMKAVDRWSNASVLSDVISVTTNAGPAMTISRTSMALSTTDGTTWNSRTFDIKNEGEGLLKWSSKKRTTYSAISAYSNEAKKLMTVPYSGRAGIQPAKANSNANSNFSSNANSNVSSNANSNVLKDIEDFDRGDYPRIIRNHEDVYAFIGDNELPNSMAQLFTVSKEDYPQGFNLTHIYMEGNYGKHPIFEVYRNAGTLSQATLLERYDAGADATPYYIDHALPECLYFAPGESFYIVVHFEDFENRNYPLGLAYGNGTSDAAHSYMSNDKGKTWSLLSEVLRGTNYEFMANECTWAITAKSHFPDWSEILTLSPSEGQLVNGEKQTVSVTHNGTKVPNGTYRTRILFDTNESEKNNLYINASMVVQGHKPEVTFNKVVEFGNLLVGQTKTITIEVFNKGYGCFSGGETYSGLFDDNISSTSDQFHGPMYLQNGLPARAASKIDLTYAPTESGTHAGVIMLTDKDGYQLRINVTGAATDPAKIAINPADGINVGDLNATTGEVKTMNFTISNEGKYPLQYVMPKFSDEVFDGIANSSTHRFGYVWQSNLYGGTDVAYEGKPELIDAVDISNQFGDYDYFSEPIDIGFDFPFYGKTYRQIYVSSFGTLSFAPYLDGLIYNMYPNCSYTAGLGVISVYGQEFQIAPSSRVEYAKQDGKFVVNFKDVLVTVYDQERIPASFHIALSPSGDIDIAFDNYDPAKVFQQGCNLWVGVVDPDQEDELTVTSSEQTTMAFWYDDESEENNRWRHIQTGTAFKFYAPKPNLIAEIAPAAGIVSPGDKLEVTAKVKASDEMFAGETYTDLVIRSNDLTASTKLVRFRANIVGDLKPEFALNKETIDFGEVFRTSSAKQSVSVENHGRNVLKLQDVTIGKGSKFSHNFTAPIEIPAGQSKDISITLNTDAEGETDAVMTITTSAGARTVQLKGKVIGVPDVNLSYSSITETIASGDSQDMPLTIENTGNEPLRFSIMAGNHLSYTPEFYEGSNVQYKYISSLDDISAKREWIDIETTGLGQQYNYTNFLKKDIIPVDLPFDFTYYGKSYRRMYVYNSGFVSFTSRRDEGIWPEPPADFPSGSIYTNVIAPYWGLHSMDITATAGIYYYVNDDMAVVSWIEYGNSMNIGVDFQLVIRKDGTFTFNYKPAFDHAVIFGAFGFSGICDTEGNGFKLPERYIELNSTVNFMPIVENTLMPGEKSFADISVVADELAGSYNSKLTLNTNIPTKPVIEIPLSLTITGEPKPEFPEDITVEQVAGYFNINANDELSMLGAFWYVPLEVKNTGTAPFTITGIDMETPLVDGKPLFTLYTYGQYTDSWTGALVNGWSPYSGNAITVGRGNARLALPLWSNDNSYKAWQTPGEYRVNLTFHISGVEGVTTKTVNVTIRITDQPSMKLDKEEIRVKAAEDDFVSIETLNISNADGKYPLRYTVVVDPTGVGEKEANTSGGIMPTVWSKDSHDIKPHDVGQSDFVYDCPDQDVLDYYHLDYNRALYWPGRSDRTTMYNYGAGTTYGTYKSATGFTGPEGGFNISHIYFAMHPYLLANKDVEFEIINGDPQNSNDVIGHGTFHIANIETEKYENRLGICTLDKPVYISEGQLFYVVTTYPTGQEYPASLVFKQDAVTSNRYLGYADNYGWFDVAALFQDGYGSLGYLCTCIETVEGDAWVKVLDAEGQMVSTLSGEIAAGQSQDIKVRMSAAETPKETDNKAILIIRTNDPKNSLTNFPVYLDKNAAPEITLSGGNLLIEEGATATISVSATDPDGDTFTLSLYDPLGIAQFTDYQDPTTGALHTYTIALQPDYGTDGNYTLSVTATDCHGHSRTVTTNFTVVHRNREPQAKPMDNIYVQTGQLTQMIDLADVFSDPDDTQLTYNITLARQDIAKVFRADNELFFRGEKEGDVNVTMRATDPAGLWAETTFTLKVRDDLSAIGAITADGLDIHTDKTGQTLIISTDSQVAPLRVSIFSPSGRKVAAATFHAAQATHTMSLADLPAGNYIVSATTGTTRGVKTIIKK